MIEYENLKKLNYIFEEDFKKTFELFINSGWYILGKHVTIFEQEFAAYCGAKHCVGLASGLDALFLSLKVFNFPKNSEVIVPSNTYIATILSIVNAGLKPVLVEPNINTYNIDVNLIEKNITNKTCAIMIVHLYGKPCEMNRICAIAEKFNLKLIEDCAQSHGATFDRQMTGTFGDISAFSFYPTKNLGACGDAGAIITNNDDLAAKIKTLRNYGSEKKYYNKYIGFNSRLDELQAALLSIKLKHIATINSHKQKLANLYQTKLTSKVVKPVIQQACVDVFHIYNIRTSNRDALKAYLLSNNIGTEIHYPVAPNLQEAYQHLFKKRYPISEEIHKTTLSLPISFANTEEEILQVIEVINSFFVN